MSDEPEFIEEINRNLGVAGRAIGHRVWQSIEYYMANYPDVRAALNGGADQNTLDKAMRTAFEDQLVQKVMPKLRGIDTRGKSKTDCLDKILGQLNMGINNNPFNLNEDFNLACELGYGQFIWQSANYLNAETDFKESEDSIKVELQDNQQLSGSTSIGRKPPEWFNPNNPDRNKVWNEKPSEEKEKVIAKHNKKASE